MLQRLLFATGLYAAALVASAFAQDPAAPTAPPKASLSGTVTASGSGAPMPDVEVAVDRGTPKETTAVTDAQGRYVLRGIEPGTRRVSANAPAANGRVGFGPSATKQVTLLPGQEMTSFDFQLLLPSRITGKVTDQNKEPVSNASVFLVSREYVAGSLRAVFTSAAATDDQGEYTLERVQAGRVYLVLVKQRYRRLEAISIAPAQPDLRRPAVTPTFYPNSPSMDGAQPVTVKAGETREGIDIRVLRGPSYCIEGVVEGPVGELSFSITETQPTSGVSGSGGFYHAVPGGTAGPDGKIRICDLHSGDYEISVRQAMRGPISETTAFGSAIVTVTDRDVKNVRVTAQPKMPLTGEVIWDPPNQDPPLEQKLGIFLDSLSRTERGSAQATVPGPFSIDDGLVIDTFRLQLNRKPPGLYIKDIEYGGRSVLYEPLRMGTALGNAGLRITVSRNGGRVTATVTDKDNNPEAACNIVLMRAGTTSDSEFAAALIIGRTDQRGGWTSEMLAPGKYYGLATNDPVDRSLETITKLLRSRTRAQEVDVGPGGSASLNLTSRALE